MNFLENITFRRTRTRSEPDDSNMSHNVTINSMPDMSEDDDDSQLKTLKTTIERLTSQLNSAHNEIESLSLENSELKKQNGELSKRNELLTKINSPAKPRCTPKKTTNRCTHSKETQTDNLNNVSENTNDKTKTSEITQKRSNTTRVSPPSRIHSNQTITIDKPKICLISSETSNILYTATEETNLRNYEICHYRKPKCGLKQILDNIEVKVQNFTSKDYSIIYIGEEDFRKTQNYVELVMFVREKLISLTHTNIIICLPTYKFKFNNNYYVERQNYGNTLYNSRIETFSNLLYMDIQTFNYAYLLDSNLNLSYNYDMYNQRTGALNSNGTKVVVSDLQDLVMSISNLNNEDFEVDFSQSDKTDIFTDSKELFFRE